MRYVIDHQHCDDPCVNLALEEYCLRHMNLDGEALLTYVNRPSVIIGRHQNPIEESDLAYLNEARIPLIRRISGGGSVYHDHGNLNYAWIKPYRKGSLTDIAAHLQPVVEALRRLGLSASVNARNDLVADGRKISGSAQFSNTRFLLIHGTLLINSDLDRLRRSLTPAGFPIVSKSRRSIRSPVANIADLLGHPLSPDDVRSQLLNAVKARHGRWKPLRLTGEDWRSIERLAGAKYRSQDWNFARTPDFSTLKPFEFAGRRGVARLGVHRWRIVSVEIDTRRKHHAPALPHLIDAWTGRPFDEVAVLPTASGRAALRHTPAEADAAATGMEPKAPKLLKKPAPIALR